MIRTMTPMACDLLWRGTKPGLGGALAWTTMARSATTPAVTTANYLAYTDIESYRAAKDANYAAQDAYFDGLRAMHQTPGYQVTGTPIRMD